MGGGGKNGDGGWGRRGQWAGGGLPRSLRLCWGCRFEAGRVCNCGDPYGVMGHLAIARVAKPQVLHDQDVVVGVNKAGGGEGKEAVAPRGEGLADAANNEVLLHPGGGVPVAASCMALVLQLAPLTHHKNLGPPTDIFVWEGISFAANQFAPLVSPAKGSATFFDGLVGTLGTGSLGVAVAGADICIKGGGGGSAVAGGKACMASVMSLWRKLSWATRKEMDSSTLTMLNWEAGTVLSGIHLLLKFPILLSPPVSSRFLSLYCRSVLIGYKYSVFSSCLDSR